MNIHTLSAHAKLAVNIFPKVATNAIVKGLATDTNGFERALAIFNAVPGSSTSPTFKLQESDTTTDGDFVDVTLSATPAVVSGTSTDVGSQLVDIDLRHRKRYLRFYIPATGGTAGVYNASFLLYNAAYGAVTQDTTTAATLSAVNG